MTHKDGQCLSMADSLHSVQLMDWDVLKQRTDRKGRNCNTIMALLAYYLAKSIRFLDIQTSSGAY